MIFSSYVMGLGAILILAVFTWVVSVIKRDVSIVDSVWSLMILLAAVVYSSAVDLYTTRSSLILSLVLVWALRLTIHIMWRNWGKQEDLRYQDIRKKYDPNFAFKSLGIIFGFQAILAWIISMPLWAALTVPIGLSALDLLAVALWTAGMVFETVGDWQLARFKGNSANREKVMDRGLWRYTRHPNYFGECILWWGLYLFALPVGGWWTIVGPILITFLLLKFSGVTLLEEHIVKRRPAYQDYIARTNAFIPGSPKKANADDHPQEQLS